MVVLNPKSPCGVLRVLNIWMHLCMSITTYRLYNEGLVIDKKKGYMMVPEQIQTADHTVLKNFIVYSLSIRLPRYLTLCLDGAILNL